MAIMHDLFGLLNVPHCHYEFLALFVDTEILTAPVSVRKKRKKNQWTFGCAPIEMLPVQLGLIQEISCFFPHVFEPAFCGFAREQHASSLEGISIDVQRVVLL